VLELLRHAAAHPRTAQPRRYVAPSDPSEEPQSFAEA
jgi:hypothetical protein